MVDRAIRPPAYLTDATSEPWTADTFEDAPAVMTTGRNLVTSVDTIEIAMHIAAVHNAMLGIRVALTLGQT